MFVVTVDLAIKQAVGLFTTNINHNQETKNVQQLRVYLRYTNKIRLPFRFAKDTSSYNAHHSG